MKLCLFSSYGTGEFLNYQIFYINTLSKIFDKVIVVTNQRYINNANVLNDNVELMLFENEGLDFGMFYKAMNIIDIKKYDQTAFINDSCIMFDESKLIEIFKWINKNEFDFYGLVDSTELRYHIQSFFIVYNKQCFDQLRVNYSKFGIINDRYEIIRKYEVELFQNLKQAGLTHDVFVSYDYMLNPSLFKAEEMILDGIPLMKKKLLNLLKSLGQNEINHLIKGKFDFNKDHIELISKHSKVDCKYLLEGVT